MTQIMEAELSQLLVCRAVSATDEIVRKLVRAARNIKLSKAERSRVVTAIA